MVRERLSPGTLERLLTTPLRRGELIGGYALGFGVAALVQSLVSSAVAICLLGLTYADPVGDRPVRIDRRRALGTATRPADVGVHHRQFQAVQFLPLVVVPQTLLCGLLLPRDQMPRVLAASRTSCDSARHRRVRQAPPPNVQRRHGLDLTILVEFVVVSIALAFAEPCDAAPVTLSAHAGVRRAGPPATPEQRSLPPPARSSPLAGSTGHRSLDRERSGGRREPDQSLLRQQGPASGGSA